MSKSDKKNDLIKVYVRQRPYVSDQNRNNVVKEMGNTELTLKTGPHETQEKKFQFDQVFHPVSSQEEVYNVVAAPLINYVLSGYTCTVFAYGQTGTGKTYTMIGYDTCAKTNFYDSAVGIVPRAAIDIFSELKRRNVEFTVRVSFTEIYNEEVRDLLIKDSPPLKVFDDPDNKKATMIQGLSDKTVETVEQLYELLSIGTAERHTASTNLNRASSRSHSIFTVLVNTRKIDNGEEVITTGKINMIDLAGSENISKSGATEMRAREAGSINKSLLTLSKVIKGLAMKQPHIPYRESKLTRILQDSLGGRSKTCMIATFSPMVDALDETLRTLEYAYMARSVANSPTVNVNRKQTNIMNEAQAELQYLRQELQAARVGDGFYLNKESYERIKFEIKRNTERISSLTQEITKTENNIAIMQKVYDDLSNLYEENNLALENVNQQLQEEQTKCKETNFTKMYIQDQINKLIEIAETLLPVCDTTTKHEEIFYKKYLQQCESNLSNAKTVKAISSLTNMNLNEIKSYTDRCSAQQLADLNGMKSTYDEIKNLHLQNIAQYDNHLSHLDTKTELWNLNLEQICADTGFGRLEHVTSSFDDTQKAMEERWGNVVERCKQLERATLDVTSKIKGNLMECRPIVEQQIRSILETAGILEECLKRFCDDLEAASSFNEKRLARDIRMRDLKDLELQELLAEKLEIQQELDDNRRHQEEIANIERLCGDLSSYSEKMDEFLNKIGVESLGTLTAENEKTAACINENYKGCENELDLFEHKNREYLHRFNVTFNAEVKQNDKDVQETFGKYMREVETIKENLKTTSKTHVGDSKTHFESILSVADSFENDLKNFIKKPTQDLENLSKNVTFQVHAGDTPAKSNYEYPKVLPDFKTSEDVKKMYRNLFSDASNHV